MLGTESQKRQLSPNKSQVTSTELSCLHSVLTQGFFFSDFQKKKKQRNSKEEIYTKTQEESKPDQEYDAKEMYYSSMKGEGRQMQM